MTFSCIRNSIDSVINEKFYREISLIWLDLLNWLYFYYSGALNFILITKLKEKIWEDHFI